MAAIVSIASRHGLTIEVCYRNQPNKSKLVNGLKAILNDVTYKNCACADYKYI